MNLIRMFTATIPAAPVCFLACALLTDSAPASARPLALSLDLCGDHYLAALFDPAVRQGAEILFSPHAAGPYGPEAGASLPAHRGDFESLVALAPDWAIGQPYQNPALLRLLARRNIAFFAVPAEAGRLEVVPETLAKLGDRLGLAGKAAEVNRRLRPGFAAPPLPENAPRALYLRPGGGSAGPGSFIDLALAAAGFANWRRQPGWGGVSLEVLALRPPPDLIIRSFTALRQNRRGEGFFAHPLFHRPPGARAAKIVAIPGRDWVCPAPSMAKAIDRLRSVREAMGR